jgi:hypothetical protein
MTSQNLIERVIERIGLFFPVDQHTALRGRLGVLVSDARQKLAEEVSRDPQRKHLLRKTFPVVAASAGVASLASLTGASEPILLDSLRGGTIYAEGIELPLQYLPDRVGLQLSRSPVFGYYAVDGSQLIIKAQDGTLNSYAGNLTITASFVPLLANLPVELEDDLVNVVAGLAAPPRVRTKEREVEVSA